MSLFDWLLIGHLIGDFAMQTDRMAKRKRKQWSCMLGHMAIYMVLITAVVVIYAWIHRSPPWLVVAVLLFVAGTHIVLDRRGFTLWWMRLMRMMPDHPWLSIVIDQVFHVLVLAIVAQVLVSAGS